MAKGRNAKKKGIDYTYSFNCKLCDYETFCADNRSRSMKSKLHYRQCHPTEKKGKSSGVLHISKANDPADAKQMADKLHKEQNEMRKKK